MRILHSLLQENHAASNNIADVQIRLAPLEDVFMAIVQRVEVQHAETSPT